MKFALYVHDFKLEIGHSNSLIELIRHLPENYLNDISEIEVVAFSTSPLNELFPAFKGKVKWVKVPFAGIRPVLLKSIFYQVWVFIYNRFFQKSLPIRVGVGISSLDVDAVSIQFIHHQWTKRGLELEASHGIRKVYKNLLFWYFEVCEKFLFSQSIKFFSPARFLTDYLKTKFPKINATTIYSGVNLSRFELSSLSREELLNDLSSRYEILKGLDISKPIYLFVGAYERKGLPEALEILKQDKDAQFIVVGSPSMGKKVNWPGYLKVFPINFTREISKFYSLADVFLFPTMYEPFGLVLFEAMAMGLTIITRKSEVGASELLDGLPEVYFSDTSQFKLPLISIKSADQRKKLREERLAKLGDVSWNKAGEELSRFL